MHNMRVGCRRKILESVRIVNPGPRAGALGFEYHYRDMDGR